ncbi:hypothetical protein CTEN210_01139 [Chaetoceros tenuissimus]|uniref:Transglutaminase-like domain-containing protein n=1 Tax=Chaetoceros tenuissimus TaxID=426638 RepID=A0AAD3CGF8_9STRA|nr:hypothetical protein CTEN210_01139 [Chaetoceros tenuissimus]
MNDQLTTKIRSGLSTVRKWEENPSLLLQCRQQIPIDELTAPNSSYAKPSDKNYQGDELLLKRLTVYFQSTMTWVNNPPCELCSSENTTCRNVRPALLKEEHEGEASRVEIYYCKNCNAETTNFPRYNSPKTLMKTKKGRCGEYANLFGFTCRALGFQVRYILDFTDHVWTEVYSPRLGRWIMCDSCEGVIDAESMYEKGWGKKLNCVLAFTTTYIADVTRRYTRQFTSPEFQQRRREVCPSGEVHSAMLIAQFNYELRLSSGLNEKQLEELDLRIANETEFLDATENMMEWNDDYNLGRQSGNMEWKLARGEAGDLNAMGSRSSATDGKDVVSVVTTSTIALTKQEMANRSTLTLRKEVDTVPTNVYTRLPENNMSFVDQMNASPSTKKEIFMKFIQETSDDERWSQVIGYCTKPNKPIYLLTKDSYPFQKKMDWDTYHLVPSSLSVEDEKISADGEAMDVDNENEETKSEPPKMLTKEEQANRVKELFATFVKDGMAPNEAGRQAILALSKELALLKAKIANAQKRLEEKAVFDPKHIGLEKATIELVLKYIQNVEENPCTPKFRFLKFANIMFDDVVTAKGGLEFCKYLGFDIYFADVDYVATIPVAANIALMKTTALEVLEKLN